MPLSKNCLEHYIRPLAVDVTVIWEDVEVVSCKRRAETFGEFFRWICILPGELYGREICIKGDLRSNAVQMAGRLAACKLQGQQG